MNYAYDNNGSLTTRTDARYTTSYRYGELNRLTGKSYSVGGGNAVTFCYDSATVCGGAFVTNGVGRLIQVSNTSSTTRHNSFDAMGRVLSSTQTTPVAGISPDPSYVFQYLYDQAWHQRSMTYPSGRQVETRWDAAARADKVSNKQGTASTPYWEVAQFAAHGAIRDGETGMEQHTGTDDGELGL
ncbi:MAG: hypothetical protein ABJF23_31515 [Bryobacteraceae bacterium]